LKDKVREYAKKIEKKKLEGRLKVLEGKEKVRAEKNGESIEEGSEKEEEKSVYSDGGGRQIAIKVGSLSGK